MLYRERECVYLHDILAIQYRLIRGGHSEGRFDRVEPLAWPLPTVSERSPTSEEYQECQSDHADRCAIGL